jgi:hypothetical protein
MAGNRLHVSTVHAVIFSACFYKKNCRCFSLVRTWGKWDLSLLRELIMMCQFSHCIKYENWWQARRQHEDFLDDGVLWIMANEIILRGRLAQWGCSISVVYFRLKDTWLVSFGGRYSGCFLRVRMAALCVCSYYLRNRCVCCRTRIRYLATIFDCLQCGSCYMSINQ